MNVFIVQRGGLEVITILLDEIIFNCHDSSPKEKKTRGGWPAQHYIRSPTFKHNLSICIYKLKQQMEKHFYIQKQPTWQIFSQ